MFFISLTHITDFIYLFFFKITWAPCELQLLHRPRDLTKPFVTMMMLMTTMMMYYFISPLFYFENDEPATKSESPNRVV